MAKQRPVGTDDDAIACPLGCGEMLLPGAEHICAEVLVEDKTHLHDFTTETCACGITAEQAVALAADETLGADMPLSSTVCLKCDAPITEVQRKTSGTCESCLAEGALHTARPTLVVVAPAFDAGEPLTFAGQRAVIAAETRRIIAETDALLAR